jgi:3-deoxy-manno-octulosonate cytidylyltransferase (CMP-KDO synthetase)
MFRIVIPARYASSRYPGKPLVSIGGKPMLQHVWERCRSTAAHEILVATDDARIATVARGFGATVEMTQAQHASGTDRIAEVALRRNWAHRDVVVNVQGDEPLLPPGLIAQVAQMLARDTEADIATLATPILSPEQFRDPNAVKVVCDARGLALYFSRAPIPWPRDAAPLKVGAPSALPTVPTLARRHLGLYAYRVSALRQLTTPGAAASPNNSLEEIEKLEQLRALVLGLKIVVADALEIPGPDVNSPEDLARVAALLKP